LTTAKWPFASKPDNGEPHECSDDNPWIAEEPAADETTAADAKPGKIKIEREQIKLEKRLCREVGKAITDFNMIEEGDKIMVCMSGGKDSYTLLDILRKLQKRAPVKFDLVAVNLDQKQPGFPEHMLPEYFKSIGVDYHIENQDTYSVVKRVVPEGKTTCGLCSRLRRAILYKVADELGCTKVALGHHRDDIVQTLMLNMFYGGRMKGMPPKLVSDDGKHVVIRPWPMCPRRTPPAGRSTRTSPSFPATSAAARTACSAWPWARCCASGTRSSPAASRACSAPWATS
jgi:tRNA 2-thiocytidine biosynthesis protein TtcA